MTHEQEAPDTPLRAPTAVEMALDRVKRADRLIGSAAGLLAEAMALNAEARLVLQEQLGNEARGEPVHRQPSVAKWLDTMGQNDPED